MPFNPTTSEKISSFEIKYKDFLKLILLKRWPYLAICLCYFAGWIVFYSLILANVIHFREFDFALYKTIVTIGSILVIAALGVGIFKGYKCFWGVIEAFKNDDGTITFIAQGKDERIVTLKANHVEKFHGFYCVKENFFNFVFVPNDFPI